MTAALPVFAGRLSEGACADDQPVAAFLRQLQELTAPPPEQAADNEIAPPVVGSEPLEGVRVMLHPVGATAVLEPCHTTATDADPVRPGAVAVAEYTQLRPPTASLTVAVPRPVLVGVAQSRDPFQATEVAAGAQATVRLIGVPPVGVVELACATQVIADCVQVIV